MMTMTNRSLIIFHPFIGILFLAALVFAGTDTSSSKKNATSSFVRKVDKGRHLQADPLFCDSIVADSDDDGTSSATARVTSGFVCVVSTDHVWNTESSVVITPFTVRIGEDVNRPIIPTETITALHIEQGTTLSCQSRLCGLSIRGFDSIRLDGTLLGSNISLQSLGSIAMDTPSGVIDTTGKGYESQMGVGGGFITGGGVLTSCNAHNHIAASHGGIGGKKCVASQPSNLAPTYDESATDFGSGGASSCGGDFSVGGGIVDLSAGTSISIASGSRIVADASPVFCSGGCSGGSGGSIRLSATSIVGSGSITANGGNAASSGGGGGRIVITADDFERSNFLLQANGGTVPEEDVVNCPEMLGGDGTIVVQCKTSTCFNGGSPLGGGQCGCTCVQPWAGKDCTECTQTCRNGGILISSTSQCECDCPDEWTGERCLSCNEDFLCNGDGQCSVVNTDGNDEPTFECTCNTKFFGSNCETFCDRDITCTQNGYCSEDGKTCVCSTGKVGADCFCDEEPPERCLTNEACSGNGSCLSGECFCDPGYVGCNCDIPCDKETTCNGHGTCNPRDGTCICDSGYTGLDCVRSPPLYCSTPEETDSGFPCLPGLLNVLGHGYNALTGELENAVIQLTFTQGKTFSPKPGQTYEIPDDVFCTPITGTTSTFESREFQSTSDFRSYLSTSVGLSGQYQAAFLSASAEYTTALEKSFLQNRVLYSSDLTHGLYKCSLIDSVLIPDIATEANLAYDNLEGNRRIQSLGTHYVRSAVFGGRVTVFNFVESCVYSEMSSNEVGIAIEASAVELASAPSASGSVDTYVESSCSVYSKNSFFSKTVNGGDRALLIVPGADEIQDFHDWFDSLDFAPGHIRLEVNPIDFVFSDLVDDVKAYIEGPTVIEYELDDVLKEAGIDDSPTICAAQCEELPSSASGRKDPFLSRGAIVGIVVGAVVLCCCFICCLML